MFGVHDVIFMFLIVVFVYVNRRRQTGRLDIAENIQSPPRAECLSLNHAGSETYSRQVNPPELDFICTHPLYTSPLTPPLPGCLSISIPASHSHVPPVSDPLLPLHDRSCTLLVLVQPSICSCTDYKRFHSSNCPHPLLAANIFMWCN